MKQSTRNKVEGTIHEAQGKVKTKVGQATNNPRLEAEGQVEKMRGKAQEKFGQLEKPVGK
jgi:uncharacterized protein YjbJ (UPF0337 family)